MLRFAIGLVLLILALSTTTSFPTELVSNNDIQNSSLIVGETVITAQLNLKPNREQSRNNQKLNDDNSHSNSPIEVMKNITEENAKSKQTVEDLEIDYPQPEEEYLEGDEDLAAVDHTKQDVTPEIMNTSPNKIYITIPIYITTAPGLPLTLSVGGHKVPILSSPLRKAISTKQRAPTSQFNRLLNNNKSHKKTTNSYNPLRQTNRHRSNIRQKLHERPIQELRPSYRKLRSYNFFFK